MDVSLKFSRWEWRTWRSCSLIILSCQRSRVILISLMICLVVVECDLPWDSEAVESHGVNFTPWKEEQFKRLLKTLTTNLINPYALVVYHARSQDWFIKKWLSATGFDRVHDCYLWKFGILLICLIFSSRCGRSYSRQCARNRVPYDRVQSGALARIYAKSAPVPCLSRSSFSRGHNHIMRSQSVLMCRSLRRGGFIYKGKTLNPFEKPLQSAAWIIQRFSKPGV